MASSKKPPRGNQPRKSSPEAELAKLLREQDRKIAAREKEFAKRRKADERDFAKKLKALEASGVYQPKAREMTRYRKSRVRKEYDAWAEFFDPKQFFFIPVAKEKRKQVLTRAEKLEMKASRTGLFIEKGGYKSAKLKFDKTSEEPFIERAGKVKRGPKAGKKYKSVTPIASLDEITRQDARFERMANKLPLSGNQRLAFVVRENGVEGYSRKTFDSLEKLREYLAQYQKRDGGAKWHSRAAMLHLYRHIEIVRTESGVAWNKEHRDHWRGVDERSGRRRRINAKGRNF